MAKKDTPINPAEIEGFVPVASNNSFDMQPDKRGRIIVDGEVFTFKRLAPARPYVGEFRLRTGLPVVQTDFNE